MEGVTLNLCKYEKGRHASPDGLSLHFLCYKKGHYCCLVGRVFMIKSRRKGFRVVNILLECLAIYIYSNCFWKKKRVLLLPSVGKIKAD